MELVGSSRVRTFRHCHTGTRQAAVSQNQTDALIDEWIFVFFLKSIRADVMINMEYEFLFRDRGTGSLAGRRRVSWAEATYHLLTRHSDTRYATPRSTTPEGVNKPAVPRCRVLLTYASAPRATVGHCHLYPLCYG